MKNENPVAMEIFCSVRNSIQDYFPKMLHASEGRGWAVYAYLPEKLHRKWIRYIQGHEGFKQAVVEDLKSFLTHQLFEFQSYVEIDWLPQGASVETDGENGCMVYVDSHGIDYGYQCHNVDTQEQATILFIALGAYLKRLYDALEAFETGRIKSDTPQPDDIMRCERMKIPLQRFPMNCANEFYQCCLNRDYFNCNTCIRNPRSSRYPRTENEWKKYSDKFKEEN